MRVLQDSEVASCGAYDYSKAFTMAQLYAGKWIEISLDELPGRPVMDKQTRLLQAAKARGLKFRTSSKYALPGKLNILCVSGKTQREIDGTENL
jgi:hypothetical protein